MGDVGFNRVVNISIGGIPLHPLIVHLAVVAVPLAAILALVWAIRPQLRRHLGNSALIASAVGVVASVVAKSSGEQLLPGMGLSESNPGPVAHHASVATWSVVASGILLLCVAALWWITRSTDRSVPRGVFLGVRLVVILAAIAALIFIVQTGHAGAQLVWLDK